MRVVKIAHNVEAFAMAWQQRTVSRNKCLIEKLKLKITTNAQ